LRDKESDTSAESTTETRNEYWRDVVGGKSRGRFYDTRDLAVNIYEWCVIPYSTFNIIPRNSSYAKIVAKGK